MQNSPVVHTPDPFGDVQGFTVGKAHVIQPRNIVETNRIHNQGIALPLTNGIAIIRSVNLTRILKLS
jgi:hypothetical protein